MYMFLRKLICSPNVRMILSGLIPKLDTAGKPPNKRVLQKLRRVSVLVPPH